jgi:hypothetical protein
MSVSFVLDVILSIILVFAFIKSKNQEINSLKNFILEYKHVEKINAEIIKVGSEKNEKIRGKELVTGYPYFECMINGKKIVLHKDLKYYNVKKGKQVKIYYLNKKGEFWCQQEIQRSIYTLSLGIILIMILIAMLFLVNRIAG